MSTIARAWRHRWSTERRLARIFDAAAFEAVEAAIAEGEAVHRGEIRFALEADLDLFELLRGLRARERALAVFAEHGIWDTEENSGVLIYLLWADHAVEIVADRGVQARVPREVWRQCCDLIVAGCAAADAGDATRAPAAVVEAVRRLNAVLADAMPAGPDDRNELPNAPISL
ncbi:MAG: TPM domain-containing protein [Lautropia sp.]